MLCAGARSLDENLSAGKRVYVSGQAGRQVVAAYLLKYLSVDEAMKRAGESSNDVRELLEKYSHNPKIAELLDRRRF